MGKEGIRRFTQFVFAKKESIDNSFIISWENNLTSIYVCMHGCISACMHYRVQVIVWLIEEKKESHSSENSK